MPRRRDPLKRLTIDELWNIQVVEYDIRALWRKLGGTVCDCGALAMSNRCDRCLKP